MSEKKLPWWKRHITEPVMAQLRQGTTPSRLAWTMAAGVAFGIFPILGSTSLVCFLVACVFKLNQPVIHLVSTLVLPLHLALILVFIRFGQQLHGAELISGNIPELLAKFFNDPWAFVKEYALPAWRGIQAWALVAPVILLATKAVMHPVLQRVADHLTTRRAVAE